MDAAFEAERTRGHTIGAHQAPESAERLDAAVRTAFQRYLAQGHADWRQLARFCDEHYVRHLVEESANCEMIVSGAAGTEHLLGGLEVLLIETEVPSQVLVWRLACQQARAGGVRRPWAAASSWSDQLPADSRACQLWHRTPGCS